MAGNITVKNWQNLPICNPKSDIHNINAYAKFGEDPLVFTQAIILKWKYGWPYVLQMDRHRDNQHETTLVCVCVCVGGGGGGGGVGGIKMKMSSAETVISTLRDNSFWLKNESTLSRAMYGPLLFVYK